MKALCFVCLVAAACAVKPPAPTVIIQYEAAPKVSAPVVRLLPKSVSNQLDATIRDGAELNKEADDYVKWSKSKAPIISHLSVLTSNVTNTKQRLKQDKARLDKRRLQAVLKDLAEANAAKATLDAYLHNGKGD